MFMDVRGIIGQILLDNHHYKKILSKLSINHILPISSQLLRLLFHQDFFLSIHFDQDGGHFRSPRSFQTFRHLHLKILQSRDIVSCLYSRRAFHHLISYHPVIWTMIQSVQSRLDNREKGFMICYSVSK